MHRHLLTPLFHFQVRPLTPSCTSPQFSVYLILLASFPCIQNLKDMTPMMVLYTADFLKEISDSNRVQAEYHFLPRALSKFTLSQIIYLAFGSSMDLDWMHHRQMKIGELFLPHIRNYKLFGPLVQYVPFTSSWELMKMRREVERAMSDIIDQVKNQSTESTTPTGTNLIQTMLERFDALRAPMSPKLNLFSEPAAR